MGSLQWREITPSAGVIVVAAGRSLASVLAEIDRTGAEWVVIARVRTTVQDKRFDVERFHYVYRASELVEILGDYGDAAKGQALEDLFLHESGSSASSRGRRGAPPTPTPNGTKPERMAATRVVDFDAFGQPLAIGVPEVEAASGGKKGGARWRRAGGPPRPPGPSATRGPRMASTEERDELNLGPMRGGGSTDGEEAETAQAPSWPTEAAAEEALAETEEEKQEEPPRTERSLALTVSAEIKAEVQIKELAAVDFRLALTGKAQPLALSVDTTAAADAKITVSLSVENDAITILGQTTQDFDPPTEKEAQRDGSFVVRGARAGGCRLSLSFWQKGSNLGCIGMAVEVVEAATAATRTGGTGRLAAPDPRDVDELTLVVEQRTEGGQAFYQYMLMSKALRLNFVRKKSKPLQDRGGGLAKSTLAYFDHVYSRLTQKLDALNLPTFQMEVAALGVNLCKELFDPEVVETLWGLRDRIVAVRIQSWEPYVPWELVRLYNSKTDETDGKFLADYGLVRSLENVSPPETLPCQSLSHLIADYPCGSLPAIGTEERAFLAGGGPGTARGLGFAVRSVAPTLDGLFETISAADFDCLHICCHAETDHQSIETAKLILGDVSVYGNTRQIEALPYVVAAVAGRKLSVRQPIVFLNACQTGRAGPSLTDEGGWPIVFLRAGAGAFVGTSWSVRDKPATLFARAFYEALRGGKTLAEAASAGRKAARTVPDASWLAFKVYGDPHARGDVATS